MPSDQPETTLGPRFVRWLLPKTAALIEEMRERTPNYIRVHTKSDRSAVILTVVIAGEDGSWITYDADQLDELIRLLQSHREDLL